MSFDVEFKTDISQALEAAVRLDFQETLWAPRQAQSSISIAA